jgi:hypothetical protein
MRILNYALVVNNDDCGVTSFGDATINKIHRVVCPNHFVAVLLHTQFAFFAAQTGVNHASHSTCCPTLNLDPGTLEPISITTSTISCPRTKGYLESPHSLQTLCKSVWQMPQNRILIFTSSGQVALEHTSFHQQNFHDVSSDSAQNL